MNQVADINNTSRYWPQFDAGAPPTKLEALLDGDCEIAAEQFVDWLADEQREELYHLIVGMTGDKDVKRLAKMWAEQAEEV